MPFIETFFFKTKRSSTRFQFATEHHMTFHKDNLSGTCLEDPVKTL